MNRNANCDKCQQDGNCVLQEQDKANQCLEVIVAPTPDEEMAEMLCCPKCGKALLFAGVPAIGDVQCEKCGVWNPIGDLKKEKRPLKEACMSCGT